MPAESIPHPCPPPPPGSPFTTPEYQKVLQFFREGGKGDRPAKSEDIWAWEMCIVHDFLMSLFERVYCYAEYAVETDDVANYLGYAEVVFYQIVSHHGLEETMIFPDLTRLSGGKTDIWTRNVAEHHEFSDALDVTWLYIRHCREALNANPPTPVPAPVPEIANLDKSKFPVLDFGKPFDPKALRKHMDTYTNTLMHHLRDEIDTLRPELMAAVSEKDANDLRDKITKHLQEYDPKWFLCSGFTAVPMPIVKQLIPIPFFVRRIIVPFVFGSKYWGFWKYSPHPENLSWAGTA